MNKKKLWIVSHYSADPRYNTGFRYINWAKFLTQRGYDVTIICASTIHNTTINLIEDNRDCFQVDYEDVHYVYVRCTHYIGNGVKRILNILEFARNLKKVYPKLETPDLVLGRLPHVFAGRIAAQMARRFRVPLICDVADLWPDSFVEHMNVSKNNPLIIGYNYLEHSLYKKTDALIFSMEGGLEFLQDRGWTDIPSKKVFHINMGVDVHQFDRNKTEEVYSYPELENPSLFKVSYCGSLRLINHVHTLCEAAKILRDRGYDDIFFSIHGYGDKEEMLKEYCAQHDLKNVRLFGKIEKKHIPYVLTHSDVNLLSYHETPLYKYGGSMSKMFEAFAAGKPVLSNVHMGYSLLDRYECGITSENVSAESFADAVIRLYNMSAEERAAMGRNARRCAEDYDQPALVDQLEKIIRYAEEAHK